MVWLTYVLVKLSYWSYTSECSQEHLMKKIHTSDVGERQKNINVKQEYCAVCSETTRASTGPFL